MENVANGGVLSREGIFISGISVQTNNSSLVSGKKYKIIDQRGLEPGKLLRTESLANSATET